MRLSQKLFLKALTLLTITFLFSTTPSVTAQDYASSANDVTPLLINENIPDVSLRNTDGEPVPLRSIVANKPTVLIFYRGGWCPYCNTHLAELQKIEARIRDLGYQVIAISPDKPENLKASISKNDLNYTLMSDSPMTVTKAFGLAFKVDEATVKRYKDVGIDLEADSGYDHHLLPAPAVYIVNREGKVRFNYVNPNYKERINGDILLTAARVFAEEE